MKDQKELPDNTEEEWLLATEAITYFRLEHGIDFDKQTLVSVATKLKKIRKPQDGRQREFEVLGIAEGLPSLFDPIIPEGYSTIPSIRKRCPSFGAQGIYYLIYTKRVRAMRIPYGLRDIWVVNFSDIWKTHCNRIVRDAPQYSVAFKRRYLWERKGFYKEAVKVPRDEKKPRRKYGKRKEKGSSGGSGGSDVPN